MSYVYEIIIMYNNNKSLISDVSAYLSMLLYTTLLIVCQSLYLCQTQLHPITPTIHTNITTHLHTYTILSIIYLTKPSSKILTLLQLKYEIYPIPILYCEITSYDTIIDSLRILTIFSLNLLTSYYLPNE